MTALLIILGVLMALLLWLIIARFGLRIDTQANRFQIYIRPFIYVSFLINSNGIFLKIRLFFIPFRIDLIKAAAKKHKKKRKKQKESKKNGRKGRKKPLKKTPFKLIFSMVKQVMHTFRIHEFYINLDTGDEALQAVLQPTAGFLSRGKAYIGFNSDDIIDLRIHISNRLIRLAYLLAKYLIIRKLQQIKFKNDGTEH